MGNKPDYSEEYYKTDFKACMEIYKLQFERKRIKRSRPPLDLTPVGAKMSDTKTLAKESPAHK